MKKIIGLLVAAIVCIGLALSINTNSGIEKADNNSTQQENDLNNIVNKQENSSNDSSKNQAIVDENHGDEGSTSKDTEKIEGSATDTSNGGESTNANINKENNPSNIEGNKEDTNTDKEKKETVTIAINAQKAIDYGILNEDGFNHLPNNGVILAVTTVEINDGDTVYDVLAKVARENKIHFEYTGAASAIYIQGIANLYEFDCGNYSGWMYEVNGIYPNYGVGAYTLKTGDRITFNYTCDLGKDLGAGSDD